MIKQNACKYHVTTRARDFTNLLAKSGGSEAVIEKNACKYHVKTRLGISQICWQNLAEVSCDQAKMACKYYGKTRTRDFTNLLAKSGGSEHRPRKRPSTAHFRKILPADV